MKTLLIITLNLLLVLPVISQDSIINKPEEPTIQIHTEKKYDNNGNLVQYDSVYTYTYSSDDFTTEEWDSMFYEDDMDSYHRYNFDHYFNRPVTGLPYQFHFDFNEDFYKNFNWPEGSEPDWEYIDSLFQKHLKSFQNNMNDVFDYFTEPEYTEPIDKENHEGTEM